MPGLHLRGAYLQLGNHFSDRWVFLQELRIMSPVYWPLMRPPGRKVMRLAYYEHFSQRAFHSSCQGAHSWLEKRFLRKRHRFSGIGSVTLGKGLNSQRLFSLWGGRCFLKGMSLPILLCRFLPKGETLLHLHPPRDSFPPKNLDLRSYTVLDNV